MTLTVPPRNLAVPPSTNPANPANPTTATTATTTTTTTATATTNVGNVGNVGNVNRNANANDGVDGSGSSTVVAKPAGSVAVPLINEADLQKVLATTAALSNSSNPQVAATFAAANTAAVNLQKATSIQVPIRLQVTTGKSAQALMNRTPLDLPGMLKEQNGVVTFYPADEALKPFDVDAAAAQHLPKNTVLIARSSKKQIDIALPDGSVERAPLYNVSAQGPQSARAQFVGVIDFVAGAPFVKDLMPPPRMVPLTLAPGGKPFVEGAIVEFDSSAANNGQGGVGKTLAEAGSPLARTWLVAAGQKLDPVFPQKSVAEAKAIEAAAAAALADPSLVDLTATPFFAIDNDHSKDIDQAMHLEKRADGGYVLSYALADAAHYIKPGSSLFEGGMQRGVSYYLPNLSIPMLPETLSEGVVSLNAHEDHRAMVLKIRIDKDGVVEGKPEVLRAKIHSQAQITYTGVSAELQGKGKVTTDIHGKAVPKAVSDQLKLFEEIGLKRIAKAKEREVVTPDRREMVIGSQNGAFQLEERGSDYASKLNAELSILSNVAGAEGFASKIPGVEVPGVYKTHAEPHPQALKALLRQVKAIVEKNGLPSSWVWKKSESLAAWVDRVKALPKTPRERSLSQVLQMVAVRVNVASGFDRQPIGHSGLKLAHYGRFSAPMREQVGILSHAILFAKTALEKAFDEAKLTPLQAQALWAPLLLGAIVDPGQIQGPRRALAEQAQALLTTTGPDFVALATKLAAAATVQAASPQSAFSSAECKLIDEVMDRATSAGNSGKMKQSQVEGASMKLLFDDIFAKDLGGNALGNLNAPKRAGTITSVTPAKVYVQLDDPDVEVRLTIEDLRRLCPNANFHLEDEGASLVGDAGAATAVGRLLIGQEINVQATHHDGDRLHFAIVD